MISLEECKRILGSDSEKMSDEQIADLRDGITAFCESFLEEYFKDPSRFNKRYNLNKTKPLYVRTTISIIPSVHSILYFNPLVTAHRFGVEKRKVAWSSGTKVR